MKNQSDRRNRFNANIAYLFFEFFLQYLLSMVVSFVYAKIESEEKKLYKLQIVCKKISSYSEIALKTQTFNTVFLRMSILLADVCFCDSFMKTKKKNLFLQSSLIHPFSTDTLIYFLSLRQKHTRKTNQIIKILIKQFSFVINCYDSHSILTISPIFIGNEYSCEIVAQNTFSKITISKQMRNYNCLKQVMIKQEIYRENKTNLTKYSTAFLLFQTFILFPGCSNQFDF